MIFFFFKNKLLSAKWLLSQDKSVRAVRLPVHCTVEYNITSKKSFFFLNINTQTYKLIKVFCYGNSKAKNFISKSFKIKTMLLLFLFFCIFKKHLADLLYMYVYTFGRLYVMISAKEYLSWNIFVLWETRQVLKGKVLKWAGLWNIFCLNNYNCNNYLNKYLSFFFFCFVFCQLNNVHTLQRSCLCVMIHWKKLLWLN